MERPKAIMNKSVLEALTAGYRKLHAKQGQLPTDSGQ